MTPPSPWSVMLLGAEHEQFGAVRVVAPSPEVGAAMSRGRYPKGYRHQEANEDALLAAGDGRAVVLAVADGHGGIVAARAAVGAIAAHREDILEAASAAGAGVAAAVSLAFAAAGRAVREEAGGTSSATTLSVWVAAGERAAAASAGDSVALLVRRRSRVVPISAGFLGGGEGSAVQPRLYRLSPGTWLLALTDGITDFVRRPWPRTVASLVARAANPGELASALVEAAFAGGAGDNVSVVVCGVPRLGERFA